MTRTHMQVTNVTFADVLSEDLNAAMTNASSPARLRRAEAERLPPLPAWLDDWRRGGCKTAEVATEGGATGDCLAMAVDVVAEERGVGLGHVVVCPGGEDGSRVTVCATRTLAQLQDLGGHSAAVCSVAVEGNLIASGDREGTIRLWSRHTGDCCVLTRCAEPVYGLAIKGDTLLSGEGSACSGMARLWSIGAALARGGTQSTGTEPLTTFSEHEGIVWSVALSQRHSYALSASLDKMVCVWTHGAATSNACVGASGRTPARRIAALRHPAAVYSLSVDGGLAASGCGDGRVRVWSLTSFACLHTLFPETERFTATLQPIFAVALCGSVLASGGADECVKLWSLVDDGHCVASMAHGSVVSGVALSPHGMIASIGGAPGSTNARKKVLMLWAPATAEPEGQEPSDAIQQLSSQTSTPNASFCFPFGPLQPSLRPSSRQ